jgi:acyl carrier protein
MAIEISRGELMQSTQPISDAIRGFVVSKFPLARKRGVSDTDLLLETGILDSLGILDVVQFIETEFGLHIEDDELLPENFQTIQKLADFVQKKRKAA